MITHQRYFLKLSYKGTAYNGWQVQKNTPNTIQQILETTISKVLNEPVSVLGCGRTDTGVHAREYYAHIMTKKTLFPVTEIDWMFRFNKTLPKDIVIHEIIPVTERAHARFDARARTYKYYITRKPSPFEFDRSWYLYGELNIKKMNQAAQKLLTYSDFKSFTKGRTQVKTTICKVTYAKWHEEDDKLIFTITADRFLRNMVRAIVGTLVEIGKEKLSIEDFCQIVESQSRSKAGESVPAQGLFLEKIVYPKEIFI